MEKNSEKLIRETSPSKNSFKDMFSEVKIKLPSALEAKQKPQNRVMEIQSYFDRSGSNIIQGEKDAKTFKEKYQNNRNIIEKQNNIFINIPLKTKNSSLNREHVIMERFCCLVKEKNQFTQQCQFNLKAFKKELLKHAFCCIKNYYVTQKSIFDQVSTVKNQKKVHIMVRILKKIEEKRVRCCFLRITQFQRDSFSFGLSNTVGDLKDNSLLKLQSQCGYLGLQTAKQIKKQSKSEKQFVQMNMSKKTSQSCGVESLSALILNHNKLNISPDTNQLYPNIPRSNKNLSSKLIASNKEIAQLSLQTRKKIQSSKKFTDKQYLPLESKKNLNDKSQKQVQVQTIMNNQDDKFRPITFTYLLKNLDFKGLTPNIESKQGVHSKIMADNEIRIQKAVNGIPMAESHYKQSIRNVFFQHNKPQFYKRSVSLQIKHLPGLFISPQKPNNQVNINRIYNNQYYNQENCNRQNLIKQTCEHRDPCQFKPRAKSAAPKVTFNFHSNNQPLFVQIPLTKIRIQQEKKICYSQPDFIVEKSLLQDRKIHLVQVNSKENKLKPNRFQVVSPSGRRDCKNMVQKLKNQQRESIKQRLLPLVFNQYCFNQQTHTHQKNTKVPLLSNSNTSTEPTCSQQKQIKKGNLKQVKNSYVKQLYFDEIQQPQAGCQPVFCNKTSQQNELKINSHKEKILVTYCSKNKV